MKDNQKISPKKYKYWSIIFWLAVVVLLYISLRYIVNEFNQQKSESTQNQLGITENQSKILGKIPDADFLTPDNPPKTNSDVLLKQQIQISELQNNYNNLRFELERLKTGDNLPKIILTFINIREKAETKENFHEDLQKLEVLSGRDFALSAKISRLKLLLKNSPKNSAEFGHEFADLVPEIISRKIELNNNQNWWGKLKAMVGKVIVVRRIDGKSTNGEVDVDLIILQTKGFLAAKQYNQALQKLNLLGENYQGILIKIIPDLQNADNLQQVSDEIYEYLKVLSNG